MAARTCAKSGGEVLVQVGVTANPRISASLQNLALRVQVPFGKFMAQQAGGATYAQPAGPTSCSTQAERRTSPLASRTSRRSDNSVSWTR